MKNKFLAYVVSFSFIICSFLSVIDFCCFDRSFYRKEHDKILLDGQHIAEYIGVSEDDLDTITEVTLEYLKDRNKTLDLQLEVNGQLREIFTDDEKTHMVDVRELYLDAMVVRNITLIIFIISLILLIIFNKKDSLFYIVNTYPKALIISLIVISVLCLFVFTDFDKFWTNFHHIFFSANELWLLDLSSDILIMIVPPQFFNDLVIRILIIYIVILLISGVACILVRKKMYHD